jgi:beta-lactamase class A
MSYFPEKSGLRLLGGISAAVRICGLLALFLSVFQGPLNAQETRRQLKDSGDPGLQRQLEELVREQGLWAATERGDLNLALVIVTDPANPRLAEINGHEMVYAASLPKIAILLGAAVAIDQGRLELDPALHKDINDMIRHSCNPCATRVLDRVGRQELLDTLQSPEYRLYDQNESGGLWVGKDYGPNSAYQRDPLAGLSHGATAFQAARFYYRLYTGTLVSPEQSKIMLEALSRPGISHKFVKGLKGPRKKDIFRKSGTWKNYHADSALVRHGGHTYIMIALAHDPDGSKWLEQLAGPMQKLAISESWAAIASSR